MTKKDYDLFRELKMYHATKPLLDYLGNKLDVYGSNQRQMVLDEFRNSLTGVVSKLLREHKFPAVDSELESRRSQSRKKATLNKVPAQRAPVRRTRFRKGTNMNSEDDNSDIDLSEEMESPDDKMGMRHNQQDTDLEVDLLPTHWSSRGPSMGRESRRPQSKEPTRPDTTNLVTNLKRLTKSRLVKFATAKDIIDKDMAEGMLVNDLVRAISNEALFRQAVRNWDSSVSELVEKQRKSKKGTRW